MKNAERKRSIIKNVVIVGGDLIGADLSYSNILFVKPDKGDPQEEKALRFIKGIVSLCRTIGLRYDCFFRNTPKGDRVDRVRIYF